MISKHLNKFSGVSLTFAIHVFDQISAKPVALQLFVQIKRSLPLNFII